MPWTQGDKKLLESVQERAIRMVTGLKGRTYLECIKEVGLTTLEDRRARGDMIQVWKTLHQKDDVDPATWFTLANVNILGIPTRNQCDPRNLQLPLANREERRNFWSVL